MHTARVDPAVTATFSSLSYPLPSHQGTATEAEGLPPLFTPDEEDGDRPSEPQLHSSRTGRTLPCEDAPSRFSESLVSQNEFLRT